MTHVPRTAARPIGTIPAPEPPLAQPSEPPLVDIRDMIVVHTALLREFRLSPALIRKVSPGDVRRAGVVGAHLHFLNDVLHHHHAGEDELLWPKLSARVPVQGALMAQMESQHAQIDSALTVTNDALAAWRTSADGEIRDRLADEMQHLYGLLAAHLDAQERDLLPLAAAWLTEEEWREIGAAGVAALRKTKLPLLFGMLMYEGDPVVLSAMLRTVPALPRLVLPSIARRTYARYARKVHGISAP
ncbi:MAG: hemerythrin domain-containing protein [Actinomycetota bacterium]|nr:hemerythrin domain-containing protein [Actinomycetota bacterium]